MNVLLASDGSLHAAVAAALVNAIAWPPGTRIDVVHADPTPLLAEQLVPETYEKIANAARAEIKIQLDEVRRELEAPERDVRARRIDGRPATALVVEAGRVRADLVVVGNRGRGAIQSMLLGSVAAEVVDQAPCPVLVARLARLRRVVYATDGSNEATAAGCVVRTWPIFRGATVHVVSVAPVPALVHEPVLAGGPPHPDASPEHATMVEALRAAYGSFADEAADALVAAGIDATPMVRAGEPTEEILRAIEETESDVVVMGSRGRTGLARLLLGSVARNVLLHAPSSVLIVRSCVAVE